MRRDDLEAVLHRLLHGPMGEMPKALGRIPEEIRSVQLSLTEPKDLKAGTVPLFFTGSLGPGYLL